MTAQKYKAIADMVNQNRQIEHILENIRTYAGRGEYSLTMELESWEVERMTALGYSVQETEIEGVYDLAWGAMDHAS